MSGAHDHGFDLRVWSSLRLAEVAAALSHWVAEDAPERPVSYTHLDVYKRQVRICTLVARAMPHSRAVPITPR